MSEDISFTCDQCKAEATGELPVGWLLLRRTGHDDLTFCNPECARSALENNLADFDRIRYGREQSWQQANLGAPEHCRDCGVRLGEFHLNHCCIEACAQCGGQLINCELSGCSETGQR
jgi:hypothetical protein